MSRASRKFGEQVLADIGLLGSDALFLDFDGTLADFAMDPADVYLPDATINALNMLHEALAGALAIISGRDIHDLSKRVPERLWRIGGHGLQVCAPGRPLPSHMHPPHILANALNEFAEANPRLRLEIKGKVLALHYRGAPDMAQACLDAAAHAIASVLDYRIEHGKFVVELKPEGVSKGEALRGLMTRAPFVGRRPLMLGDDTTDESAFVAASNLGGLSVKVGEGDSCAILRASSPASVRAWVEREASRAKS